MIYFKRMLESEQIKLQKTKHYFEKKLNFMQHICNFFIALPLLTGELCDESDINSIKIQDPFGIYMYDVPFKIRSIWKLLEIANYSDAAIILRTLAESTIAYKFYISQNDGDGLERYIFRNTKRSIKDIMNAIIPGYYENVYDKLCNFTHGNAISQAIFRANTSNKESFETHIENINSNWFNYVFNQTIALVPCVIGMYDEVFPNNRVSYDYELLEEKNYITKTICDFISTKADEDKDKKTFYPYYQRLLKPKK